VVHLAEALRGTPRHSEAPAVVTLIDSPVANTANIARALRASGAELEITRDAALNLLHDQYEWNFPPDRYRATRDRATP